MTILPVLNKIDMKNADVESSLAQMKKLFEFNADEVMKVSAKTGVGVRELLDVIVEKIPPPQPPSSDNQLKAIVFDLWYEKFKGIVLLVRVFDGSIKVDDQIVFTSNPGKVFTVKELNVLHPQQVPIGGNPASLKCGQVAVLVANIHDYADVSIGETIVINNEAGRKLISETKSSKTKSIQSNPMVFASIYSCEKANFIDLQKSLQKLLLNDASVSMARESHPALGNGFKLGFLGLLHMEVFCQRLDDEFDQPVMVTAPSVPYKVQIYGEKNIKFYGTDELLVTNASQFPSPQIIKACYEPIVKGTIIVPDQYLNGITTLCMSRRAQQLNSYYIDNNRILLEYTFPLSEVIIDFYDHLKSVSSGYASFDYENVGFAETNLVKLEFKINDKEVPELAMLVHNSNARTYGKSVCDKLAEHLQRQQFKVKIQAVIGSKVVGRSDIKAYRKDVTAKLYGGDSTRRMKLLARQAEGKKKLRMVGNIEISPDTFINVLKR